MSTQQNRPAERGSEINHGDLFAAAKDRIRDAIKWIIGGFGAIGAVLVAGLSISSIGSLELWSGRFWAATLGGVAALSLVSAAIVAAARVLAGSGISLAQLAAAEANWEDSDWKESWLERKEQLSVVRYLQRQPQLLRNVPSFAELHQRNLALRRGEIDGDTEVEKSAPDVLDVASWAQLLARYKTARAVVVVATFCAAIGMAVFAWAANPPPGEVEPVAAATSDSTDESIGLAAPVHLLGSQAVVSAFEDYFSDGCSTAAVDAVYTLHDDADLDVVAFSSGECEIASIDLALAADGDIGIRPGSKMYFVVDDGLASNLAAQVPEGCDPDNLFGFVFDSDSNVVFVGASTSTCPAFTYVLPSEDVFSASPYSDNGDIGIRP